MTNPWPNPSISALCDEHGLVEAERRRGDYELQGGLVEDVLAYVCPDCGRVLAVPHISAGRVFAARMAEVASRPRDFRVPKEAKDLALGVHAVLGIPASGDPYSLPIHLGLGVVRPRQDVEEGWTVLDKLRASERARPCLTDEVAARISRLRERWDVNSDAAVVRRLVAVAWYAAQHGLSVPSPAATAGTTSTGCQFDEVPDWQELPKAVSSYHTVKMYTALVGRHAKSASVSKERVAHTSPKVLGAFIVPLEKSA